MNETNAKALTNLMSMRSMLNNYISIITNNANGITSITNEDYNDERLNVKIKQIQNNLNFLFHTDLTKCYDRCKQLLDEINCLIDDICPHSYVDDEIEHIYSGSLIKIRYCDICGKTVD